MLTIQRINLLNTSLLKILLYFFPVMFSAVTALSSQDSLFALHLRALQHSDFDPNLEFLTGFPLSVHSNRSEVSASLLDSVF